MPTNKLPLLGGGERELQDGDRVRLRCGIDDTIRRDPDQIKQRGDWVWDGLAGFTWRANGTNCPDSDRPDECDIVLILGPESVDNGDGTVTKVCTLPVTMPKDVWGTHEPKGVGRWDNGTEILCCDGSIQSEWFVQTEKFNRCGILSLRSLRKHEPPQPSPFVKELVRRLCLEDGDAEKVVLPPACSHVFWASKSGQNTAVKCWWFRSATHYTVWPDLLGPLPSLQDFPHDGDMVSLDEVREMVKEATQ